MTEPTQEEIEKVARAICFTDGFEPDEISKNWVPGQAYWTGYIDHAKAAIRAMQRGDDQ
jgi:hypothetical protein